MLNKHMHFLVGHYSDKLVYFDTNSFVETLKSTRDTVYLPVSFRHIIARLLAFYINSDISSMSKSCIINTTMVSNNTNNKVVSLNKCSSNAISIYSNCTKEVPCPSLTMSSLSDDVEVLGLTPDNHLN